MNIFPKILSSSFKVSKPCRILPLLVHVATSTSGAAKCKRKPRSGVVRPVGCSRAEGGGGCLGRLLTVFYCRPALTCISNSYVAGERRNFSSIVILENFPVGRRERERALRRPMSLFFPVLFISHVWMSGSRNLSGESVHVHLCENTRSLCVFGEQ